MYVCRKQKRKRVQEIDHVEMLTLKINIHLYKEGENMQCESSVSYVLEK